MIAPSLHGTSKISQVARLLLWVWKEHDHLKFNMCIPHNLYLMPYNKLFDWCEGSRKQGLLSFLWLFLIPFLTLFPLIMTIVKLMLMGWGWLDGHHHDGHLCKMWINVMAEHYNDDRKRNEGYKVVPFELCLQHIKIF